MPLQNTLTSYNQGVQYQMSSPQLRDMGGSLLHKLKWRRGDTYGEIAKAYVDITVKHYQEATVLSDGYEAGPEMGRDHQLSSC